MKELDNYTCRTKNVLAKQLQLLWRTAMVIATVFLLNPVAFAQDEAPDLPDPARCVSQDLEAIGARLTGDSPCYTCEEGQEIISTLELSIFNKTGSTRTSIAFWATLVITDAEGNETTSYIDGCSGPIEGGETKPFPFSEQVEYTCGDELKLTDIYLAWTDASDGDRNQCPLDPSKIAPKCRAQVGEIVIIPPLSASVETFVQPCVGEANGSINVSAQGGSGEGYTYTLNPGGIKNSTGEFTGLEAGTYTIRVEDSEGCFTEIEFELEEQVCCVPPTVTAQPGDESVCEGEAASFTVAYTGGDPAPTIRWQVSTDGTNWTYVENGGAYSGATTATLSISATTAAMDGNMYRAELTSGTCDAVYSDAADLVVNEIPAAPESGGDQVVCATDPIQTLTATATAPEGSVVVWYTAATGGTVVASPTLNMVGSVTYHAQSESRAGCISTTRTAVTLTINATPDAPVVEDDEFCATTGTVTLADYIEADGDVIFTDAEGNAMEVQPTTLSRATAGIFTYYVIQVDGECESEVASFTITINAVPNAPEVEVTHPTCATAGSITVTAPLGEGLQYSINGGTTWQSGVLFADVAPGTYTVWVRNADDCRAMTENVVVNPVPDAPAAPVVVVDQPDCTDATATITITSNTEGLMFRVDDGEFEAYPEGGWVVTEDGEYTIVARNAAMCLSAATKVMVNPQPATPVAPTVRVVQPTCTMATGSITVTAPLGEGLQYSINGTTWQDGTVFADLAPGTYTIWVENEAGCKAESADIIINPQPATPTAPTVTVVQPTCAAGGSITVTGPLGEGLQYSITDGKSWQSGLVFADLAAGTYTVWVRNAAGCMTESDDIVINPVPDAPAAPVVVVTQPTCTVATGTIVLTSSTDGLLFSFNGGAYAAYPAGGWVVASGEYTLSAMNRAQCISGNIQIVVKPQPETPAAPTVTVVHPTCIVATGSITVTAPLGEGYEYSINDGDTWQEGITFAGLMPGVYTVWAMNADGCMTESANITINAQPTAPAAATLTVVQPTCERAGSITVTAPTGEGLEYSINDGETWQGGLVFANVGAGTYTVWVRNAAGCMTESNEVTVNPVPSAPAAPVVMVTQPTCTSATAMIMITSSTDGLMFSLNGGAFAAYPAGGWSVTTAGEYTVMARNAAMCVSGATRVGVNAQPAAPAAPTARVDQPTCTMMTGAITVTAPLGEGMMYSLNGGTYQAGTSFSGLAPGNYTLTAKNAAGCVSGSTAVTINNAPSAPAAPTATVTQPTCIMPMGMITITAPTGAGMMYSLNGGAYQASVNFGDLMPGSYTLTVRNAAGCVSAGTTVVVNNQPGNNAPIVKCETSGFTYEDHEKGLFNVMHTSYGLVGVTARKRNPDGTYAFGNHAALFDTQAPTGDDTDLYTTDWGLAAIINQDQTNVPNDNQWGGEIIFNFAEIGPVTMQSLKALDIDSYENMSWVYLYDAAGRELYKVQLQNIGNNSKQVVDLGNTRGVVTMKVVLDGRNESGHLAGSGAIDEIEFCVEEDGSDCRTIGFPYADHSTGLTSIFHTPWGDVDVMGRKRNPDGSFASGNYAALFDTQNPTGDDTDLYTVDWGLALIINQDQTNVPNDNRYGGELIIDFSNIGPVTMESLKALDIDIYSNDAWVYLYDADGEELYKVQLKNIGDNSKQDVDLGGTKGVMSMKVVFNGRDAMGNLTGSGAIDEIRFCVEAPCVDVAIDGEVDTEAIEVMAISNVKAYPTPFRDRATIEFTVKNTEDYVVNLYDTKGMLVKQLKAGTAVAGELNTVEVDGSSMAEGMYLARIATGSGAKTVKLILER